MSERAAGILMPISSLPSEYGIGCFSKSAYEFVDWLKGAGQSYWQILPLGPTSYGDSPYQSFSTFAGNPYFISRDELIEEGVLTRAECEKVNWGKAKGIAVDLVAGVQLGAGDQLHEAMLFQQLHGPDNGLALGLACIDKCGVALGMGLHLDPLLGGETGEAILGGGQQGILQFFNIHGVSTPLLLV